MILKKENLFLLKSNSLFVFFFFILCGSQALFSQNNTEEEIKRLQRAIFITNFSQQIIWPDIEDNRDFKIGVLGPDRTVLDIQSLAQQRRIYNKKVEVKRFSLVKDIDDIQVLYVNNKYNYDIEYILKKIANKPILLITEDYEYNTSMINMVNIGMSFEYEINSELLRKHGFIVSPSLREHSITTAEKWKDLYLSTEKSLKLASEKTQTQQQLLEKKNKQLKNQKETINLQQNELVLNEEQASIERKKLLKTLSESNEFHTKKYEEKLAIERELEENIQQQINFIKYQERIIDSSNAQISLKTEFLELQRKEIAEKEIILNDKVSEIDSQKKANLLLLALLAIVLIASFIIYRNYLSNKKLNKLLSAQKLQVELQSLALEQKNRDLEQFAYIASHDLKEPLNSISSLIDILQQEYGNKFDDVGNQSLEYVKSSSDRMRDLIDALLSYSRLGVLKEEVKVNTEDLIVGIQEDLKFRIDEKKALIVTENLPVITGSPTELRMLFQNLIGNALKFVAEDVQPRVEISCSKIYTPKSQTKGVWEFAIKDNGIGIAKKYHERVFSIFQRLHARDTYEGTGIGLAHCKKIVEAHGGKIRIESSEGNGATFYFTIPFQE